MKTNILFCIITSLMLSFGCKKNDDVTIKPRILLKNGDYTINDQYVPVGGKLKFGITATDGNAIITNLRIQRIADGQKITELDKGLFIKDGGLDFDYNAAKSSATQEVWIFFVMNSNRDSAYTTLTVNLGSGSAYGEIYHYPSLIIGMQNNPDLPNFLDLHTGNIFSKLSVTGHEADIDLLAFVYTTSGVLSPTLCCPGYSGSSSATGFYPIISSWGIKNQITYDYYASDNNLISTEKFDHAQNDSLLVTAYSPEKVSGLCKFCNTGKIIPFKTQDGKYGLARVIHADLSDTGSMELDIKIQK